MRFPHVTSSFEAISANLRHAFLFRCRSTGMELKGQMIRAALAPAPATPAPAPAEPPGAGGGGGGAAAAAAETGVWEEAVLVFLCAPRSTGLEDLARLRIRWADFPLHDASRDYILLAEQASLCRSLCVRVGCWVGARI